MAAHLSDCRQYISIRNLHPASEDYGNNFIGPSFLYRAEVASAIGLYDFPNFGGEDYDFWLRMHLTTRIHHVEEPLYLYRVHDNTISGPFDNLGLPETSVMLYGPIYRDEAPYSPTRHWLGRRSIVPGGISGNTTLSILLPICKYPDAGSCFLSMGFSCAR